MNKPAFVQRVVLYAVIRDASFPHDQTCKAASAHSTLKFCDAGYSLNIFNFLLY